MRQEECELQIEKKLQFIRGPKDMYKAVGKEEASRVSPAARKALLLQSVPGFATQTRGFDGFSFGPPKTKPP